MATAEEIKHHEKCTGCGRPMELEVLQSGAGWYLGTQCPNCGPHTRESHYFPSDLEAQSALRDWLAGNKVHARDAEFHQGELVEIPITPDAAGKDLLKKVIASTTPDEAVLTTAKVMALQIECLPPEGTTHLDEAMLIPGIMRSFVYIPAKIEEHHLMIKQLLNELPEAFRSVDQEHGAGGASFLDMLFDRHGNQWTGLHEMQESLMCLGMAAGYVNLPAARNLWDVLPGGMPYFTVLSVRVPASLLDADGLESINQALAYQASNQS